MRRIDFDHNATTRPHRRVREAVLGALDEAWGNPSSLHGAGRAARDRVERARAQVAALVGGRPEEIVLTSGGTEADNLALRGAAHAARATTGRRTLIASPLEHPAVLRSLAALADEGFRIAWLPVDGAGRIALDGFAALLDAHRGEVALVSVALANHELGNRYPVAALASLGRAAGALVHTDAVQAAGKEPLDAGGLGVDLLALSAHKIHGPKGAGALWVRRGLELPPLVLGGHQERERRAGTENVPGVVGFGVACEVAREELLPSVARVAALRDRLEAGALAIPGARRFGDASDRVCGTACLGWEAVDGELLAAALDLEGVAVSTGAACSSGSIEPSPVVLALGAPRAVAKQAVRFSLGADNTPEEVDAVLALLPDLVDRVRRATE